MKSSIHYITIYIYIYIYNQPNESCSHLSEKASKGRLFGPYKLQKNTKKRKRKGKKTRWKKGGEQKKAMVALLVFVMAPLKIVFARKKLFDAKGPFGGNAFKNLYVFHFLSFFIFKTEFFGTIEGDDQAIRIIK